MNVNKPFFSVIIPTYNRDYCILDAVNSVLKQKFVDFELIIVDDASSDNTLKLLQQVNDFRIKIISNKINQGQSGSINEGVAISKGRFIAFLDSDDFWSTEYLSTFHSQIIANPLINCFYCWLNTENGVYKEWSLTGNIYKEALYAGELSSTITLVVSKEAFIAVDGFDRNFAYGNDDDFCFRLAKKYTFFVIKKPLATSRSIDPNAMTKISNTLANGKKSLLERYKDDILEFLGKKELAKKYYELSCSYFLAKDLANFRLFLKVSIDIRFNYLPFILRKILYKGVSYFKINYARKN